MRFNFFDGWLIGAILGVPVLVGTLLFQLPTSVLLITSVICIVTSIIFGVTNRTLTGLLLSSLTGASGLISLAFVLLLSGSLVLKNFGTSELITISWIIILMTVILLGYPHIMNTDYVRSRKGLLTVKQLILDISDEKSPDRAWKVVQLVILAGYRAVPYLLVMTKDPDPTVQEVANLELIYLFGKKEKEHRLRNYTNKYSKDRVITKSVQTSMETRVRLLVLFVDNINPDVRTQAINYIIQLGLAAIPTISRALAQHPEYAVRVAMAKILGQLGQAESIEPLLAALQDEDYRVRVEVVNALGHVGNSQVIQLLTYLLSDPKLRKDVLRAIKAIQERESN